MNSVVKAAVTEDRWDAGLATMASTETPGLHLSIIEMTRIATTVDYRPANPRLFQRHVLGWSHAWADLFAHGLTTGAYDVQDWTDQTERFALAQLATVSHECRRWMVDEAGRSVLLPLDARPLAGPAVREGDTFFRNRAGRIVASFGPRCQEGTGVTGWVSPASGEAPHFWGVYAHDDEGYAALVGDALDRDSAQSFAEQMVKLDAWCTGETAAGPDILALDDAACCSPQSQG